MQQRFFAFAVVLPLATLPRMRVTGIAACIMLLVTRAQAQGTDTTHVSQDAAIARARQLANAGDDIGSRRIIDSLFKVLSPDSAAYADVLYMRAALAPTAVDAERDYRRLLVEAPLSGRAADALLQLAKLEQARGDRRAASDHLQRFLLSYPDHPERPRAAVTLVRLLFDQGDVPRGCAALRVGRESVPQANAELRNQLEFYAPRCALLEQTAGGADSAATDTARVDSTRAARRAPARSTPAVPPSTARSQRTFYSVQVAAYDSQEPATRMAKTLVARGIEARVDGKARPFRVRVGKYATRAEAVRAQVSLKAQGINGFIALVK